MAEREEEYEENYDEGDRDYDPQDDPQDDEGSPDCVFVGSLSFETTTDDLSAHLSSLSLESTEITFFEQNEKSKGCALVRFGSEEDAQAAIASLNHTTLNDREIFAREDRGPRRPRRRRRRVDVPDEKREPADPTYLYVGNIVYSVTSEELRDLFSKYGNVVEATISQQRRNKKSLGWGIVQFETKEEAAAALDLNNTEFRERALRVEALEKAPIRGRRRNRRRNRRTKEKVDFEEDPRHLYVGNLAWSVESDELKEEFAQFGDVINAEVAKDRTGRSRGWGSVEFAEKDDAAAAMEDLQGKDFFERPLNIQIKMALGKGRRTKPKSETRPRREPREREGTRKRGPRAAPDRFVQNPKCHLFVGNLPWSVDDDGLAELFSKQIGEVVDAIVTKDPRSKRSRGWGTVEMAHEEDAEKAIHELHESEHLERRLLVRYDSFVKVGEDCD